MIEDLFHFDRLILPNMRDLFWIKPLNRLHKSRLDVGSWNSHSDRSIHMGKLKI